MNRIKYAIFVTAMMISWAVPANDIFDAVAEVDTSIELGPITACFDKMREFACPIASQMPVVKDAISFLAPIIGMSCPTGGQPVPKE